MSPMPTLALPLFSLTVIFSMTRIVHWVNHWAFVTCATGDEEITTAKLAE